MTPPDPLPPVSDAPCPWWCTDGEGHDFFDPPAERRHSADLGHGVYLAGVGETLHGVIWEARDEPLDARQAREVANALRAASGLLERARARGDG